MSQDAPDAASHTPPAANSHLNQKLFSNRIHDFQVDVSEHLAVVFSSARKTSDSLESPRIEKSDLIRKSSSIIFDASDSDKWPISISNIAHGKVLVASLVRPRDTTSRVKILQIEMKNGQVVKEVALEDILGFSSPNAEVFVVPDPAYSPILMRISFDGEITILVRTKDFKIRLLRLSPQMTTISNTLVTDQCTPRKGCVLEPMLLEVFDHRIAVVLEVDEKESKSLQYIFGIPVTAVPRYSILFFKSDGTLYTCHFFEPFIRIEQLSLSLGQVLAVGSRLTESSTQVSVVAVLNIDRNLGKGVKIESYREFSLEPSSSSIAFTGLLLNNGNILLGGISGFQQVPTGSVIKGGSAYIAEINRDGKTVIRHQVSNDRDNRITRLRSTLSRKILYSGVYNGPITHDSAENRFSDSSIEILSDN